MRSRPALAPGFRPAAVMRVVALSLLTACASEDGGDDSGTPTSITASTGNNQSATVGTAVTLPPAVLVQGSAGPIEGIDVTFAVASGGGAITGAATVQTNGAGIATVGKWTLGVAAGPNTLTATVAPLAAITFNATGTARIPTSITVSAGNNQTATIGTAVPLPPAALVQDALGPIPGLDVTFAVTVGGGSIAGPATVQTNANGIATVGGWTLGGMVGPNTLTATVAPLAALPFNATGAAVVTQLNVLAGNGQNAFAGNYPTTVPQVRLTQGGNPVVGAMVEFAVTAGGGTLTRASVTTDAGGNASPSAWRFGALGAQTVSASVPADPGVTPVTINGTATAAPASQYTIVVEFLGTPPSASQQAIFLAAAARWSQVILGDVQDIASIPATTCSGGVATPARSNIDDLHIFAVIQPIDGGGGTLGAAGPCFVRSAASTNPRIAIAGAMIFDDADANTFEAAGQFDEIVLHEMGHVLGIGTQWGPESFAFDMLRPTTCSAQGFYRGVNAQQPFLASTTAGTYPRPIVPVEDNATLPCPGGTRDGHWKEEPGLGDELMTGFIEAPGVTMPLSAFTAASLRDLGYTVNDAVADAFSFTPPLMLRMVRALTPTGIQLRNDMLRPIGEVDGSGRVRWFQR